MIWIRVVKSRITSYNVCYTKLLRTLVDKLLKEKSENEKAPDDWCYVNNFDDYTKPIVIKLPNKMGKIFKKDIQELIRSFQEKIPLTFKEKEYLKIKKSYNFV